MAAWRCDGCFQSVIDGLQEGLIVIRDGRIIFANAAISRLLGHPAGGVVGMTLSEIVASQDAEQVLDRYRRRVAGEDLARDVYLHLRHADGSTHVAVRAAVSRFRHADDTPTLLVSLRDLTEQERTEQALHRAETMFRRMFEDAVDGIYQTSPDGRYLAVNPALARIYGYESVEELMRSLTDISCQLYVEPEQRERFKAAFAGSDVIRNFEAEIYRKDGSTIWISETARCVRDDDGNILYYEGMVRDITQRKEAIEKIRLLAKVFESVTEAVLVTNPEGKVQVVNRSFETMTGWLAAEVLGKPFQLIADDSLDAELLEEIHRVTSVGGSWQGEVACRRKSGSDFPAWLSISGVRQDDGSVPTIITLCSDLTLRKATEAKIRFQQTHDAITGLPNRKTVLERLAQAVERAGDDGTHVILLLLGLDRFKSVNDSFGHAAGDMLLTLVGRRLRSCVGPADTVGRIGGDEFAIVLADVPNRDGVLPALEKLIYAFSDPFDVAGRQLFLTPSIGISVFPGDGSRAEDLLSNAGAAMYHAKKEGGTPFRFFQKGMNRQAIERLTMEQDLRQALHRDEFLLHYQPKLDLLTGEVVGAEALIRWYRPAIGMTSPATFIPLAEEAGLINQIGIWTLGEACAQLRRWRAEGLELPSISVNLSAAQFHDPNLVPTVRAVLNRYGLMPDSLDLEITETMVASDVESAILKLTELKNMGVHLSIDDFGTGYSSLSYLKKFPINCLKIDQAFVRDLPLNRKDEAIISSIVVLAENLGFHVIAEGVETAEQAELLRLRGCRVIQGYFFSRPLDAHAFAEFLRAFDRQRVLEALRIASTGVVASLKGVAAS